MDGSLLISADKGRAQLSEACAGQGRPEGRPVPYQSSFTRISAPWLELESPSEPR